VLVIRFACVVFVMNASKHWLPRDLVHPEVRLHVVEMVSDDDWVCKKARPKPSELYYGQEELSHSELCPLELVCYSQTAAVRPPTSHSRPSKLLT